MASFAPRSLSLVASLFFSILMVTSAVAETQMFKAYGRVENLEVNRWTRKGYLKVYVFESSRTTNFTVGFKTEYQPDRPQNGDTVEIVYFKKSGQLVAREVKVRSDYTPPPPSAAREQSSPPPASERASLGPVLTADRPMSGTVKVTSNSSNTRSGPGTQYGIVQIVYRGTELSIEGATGDWYLVALPDGQRSWVHNSLVSGAGSSEPEPEAKPEMSTKSIPKEEQVTIGVLEFQSLNEEAKKDQLGRMISEIFTTSLVDSRAFKIIEREQLDKVVRELELKQTGMVETAAQAGKLLGANAVITGSVMKIGNILRIDARIIDTTSALVISAETNTGGYDLVEIGRMADKIVRELVQGYYFEGKS
ncbi:MAG: SH3 domain-containing protein [Deltaproteobacteria bacterium]|nr:SH3 domain-containing protein [Deltaproteobacteria bacterium]